MAEVEVFSNCHLQISRLANELRTAEWRAAAPPFKPGARIFASKCGKILMKRYMMLVVRVEHESKKQEAAEKLQEKREKTGRKPLASYPYM